MDFFSACLHQDKRCRLTSCVSFRKAAFQGAPVNRRSENRDMPVIEKDCEIRAAAGTTDAVLCRREGEGQWPGILYLTDVGGIRPSTREQIRRLAAEGYMVLMPNLFYRTARPPVFEVKPGDAEA